MTLLEAGGVEVGRMCDVKRQVNEVQVKKRKFDMKFSNKVYILKLEGINKTFKLLKIKHKKLVS